MHETCTNTKKTKKNKPLDASNLQRHQKKIKKIQELWVHLSSCWNFWCLSMFCEVRVTKPAQAPKKNKKKQTTRCTKPAQAPKKPKELKFPGTMGPLLSSCWNCCFFWFFWCLPMFGASSGLVFLVFFGACQCFVKSESPNLHRHQKKTKKTNH